VASAGVTLARRQSRWGALLRAANLPLAAAVFAWGALVVALARTGPGEAIAELLPTGDSWAALVGAALVAMLASVSSFLCKAGQRWGLMRSG